MGFDFDALDDMGRTATPEAFDDRQDRERLFRQKVSLQQFMNHNGPIFKAFAFSGIAVTDVTDGDVLLKPTSAAAALTRLVAQGVEAEGIQIGARESSFFRGEAANWVAERWLKKEDFNIEAASREIVAAVKNAMNTDGAGLDHDPFKDDNISGDASLMMSAAGVTAKLMDQVKVYDFRLGKNEVLKKLLDTVIGTSVEMVGQMLPPGTSKNDIVNVTQTVSKNLSGIMEGIYGRKAREVTNHLKGRDKRYRVEWLARNKPLDRIISDFQEWAHCFSAFAIATSQRMGAPKTQNSQAPGVSLEKKG